MKLNPGATMPITFSTFYHMLFEAKQGTYNDEHAFAHLWNHAVGGKTKIGHDHAKMTAEIEKAKKNPNPPLSFENAPSAGFQKGIRDESARDSYFKELHTAAHTVHALATHPDFKDEVKRGDKATVMGASKGKLSALWGKHGASNKTSKSDVAIGTTGIKTVSMKKGGGSQLMSAGPEENMAVHEHATNRMIEHGLIKKEHQKKILDHIKKANEYANQMKYYHHDEKKQGEMRDAGQKHIDAAYKVHPELNEYVHHEAATGHGKFDSTEHRANYLAVGATKNSGASVVDTNKTRYTDKNSPHLRLALPKERLKNAKPGDEGRSGNFKIDH